MAIAIWDAKVVKERELVSAEQQEKLYLFTFYLAWAKRLPLTSQRQRSWKYRQSSINTVNMVRKIIFPNGCLQTVFWMENFSNLV